MLKIVYVKSSVKHLKWVLSIYSLFKYLYQHLVMLSIVLEMLVKSFNFWTIYFLKQKKIMNESASLKLDWKIPILPLKQL